MKGISLFSSAGIAETYFKDCNIDIVGASELVSKRAELHKWLYPQCSMVCGDITNIENFKKIKNIANEEKCEFLLATPPCQGMSSLGKKDYDNDKRNYLIFYAMDLIDECNFNYILIENVPKFLKLYFPYHNELHLLIDIFKDKYSQEYEIDSFVLNAKDYGVPQSRPRGFIRLWKKGLKWGQPEIQKEITLYEAIGNLPSLESGEDSGIKWHFAKNLFLENPIEKVNGLYSYSFPRFINILRKYTGVDNITATRYVLTNRYPDTASRYIQNIDILFKELNRQIPTINWEMRKLVFENLNSTAHELASYKLWISPSGSNMKNIMFMNRNISGVLIVCASQIDMANAGVALIMDIWAIAMTNNYHHFKPGGGNCDIKKCIECVEYLIFAMKNNYWPEKSHSKTKEIFDFASLRKHLETNGVLKAFQPKIVPSS